MFGYASKLYPPDEHSTAISKNRHLILWNDDSEVDLRIDRYGDGTVFFFVYCMVLLRFILSTPTAQVLKDDTSLKFVETHETVW